jgi:hypothetical protein
MQKADLVPRVTSLPAAIGAGWLHEQWQQVLGPLAATQRADSVRVKGRQQQQIPGPLAAVQKTVSGQKVTSYEPGS